MKIDPLKLVGPFGLMLLVSTGMPSLKADDASPVASARIQPAANAKTQPEPFSEAQVEKIVADIQGKVAASAPAKDFDGILQRIASLSPALGSNYVRDSLTTELISAREFTVHWQDYILAEEAGNYGKAGQAIGQLVQESAQLYPIIPRSELLARQDETSAQMVKNRAAVVESLVKHLGAAIDRAKAPVDFDGVLGEIETAQEETAQFDSTLNMTLQGLRRYAGSWQELYAQLNNGAPTASYTRTLDNLSRDTSSYALELRSRVDSRYPKQSDTSAHTGPGAPTKPPETLPDPSGLTLQNVEKYLNRLNQAPHGNTYTGETQAAAADLAQTVAAKNKLMLGDPMPALELYSTRSFQPLGDYAMPIAEIHSILALRALNYQFREIVPDPNDTVGTYLDRIMKAKIKDKDWQGVIDALQDMMTANSSFGMQRSSLPADLAAYHSLIVGIHQEAAEQYSQAIASYLEALSSPGSYTPVDELAARLKAMKLNHPKEYLDGQAAANSHESLLAQLAAMRAMNPQQGFQRNGVGYPPGFNGNRPGLPTPAPSAAPQNVAPSHQP